MPKATDQLLKDHKMIRKILESFSVDHPRFSELTKTLQRVVLGHAWFEDEIFLPAVEKSPLLHKHFTEEIYQEHKDIAFFLKSLHNCPLDQKKDLESLSGQLTGILKSHLLKEEEALFPIAERILDTEGLNQLTEEMEKRKTEVRGLTE